MFAVSLASTEVFMNILKKLFKNKKKQKKQENQCWYNNYHEKKSRWDFHPESADLGGTIPAEISSAKSIAQQQT